MMFHRSHNVKVMIPQNALDEVFDQCDGFTIDETGGRIIGTYKTDDKNLLIKISGIIEAGPNATRSNVTFFQDGEYQERVFREIERSHPNIEHLGNWHTHHVNGYPRLSDGDIATYKRTVNHSLHNLPFFYALLVTSKKANRDPEDRYDVKHYVLNRGDDKVYEIPHSSVTIEKRGQLVWPRPAQTAAGTQRRAHDAEFIAQCFPSLRTFHSKKLGLYWRGSIGLVDGTEQAIVVLEDASSEKFSYSISLQHAPKALEKIANKLQEHAFPSAAAALTTAERACNRILYQEAKRSSRETA